MSCTLGYYIHACVPRIWNISLHSRSRKAMVLIEDSPNTKVERRQRRFRIHRGQLTDTMIAPAVDDSCSKTYYTLWSDHAYMTYQWTTAVYTYNYVCPIATIKFCWTGLPGISRTGLPRYIIFAAATLYADTYTPWPSLVNQLSASCAGCTASPVRAVRVRCTGDSQYIQR